MADLFDEIEKTSKTGDVFEGDLFDEVTREEPSPTWKAVKKTAETVGAMTSEFLREATSGATLGAVNLKNPEAEYLLRRRQREKKAEEELTATEPEFARREERKIAEGFIKDKPFMRMGYDPTLAIKRPEIAEEAPLIPEWQRSTAHLAGEFLPIGNIMKVIGPVVKKVLSGAGMVRTAATEAALTGVTYEAAKGAAQGKDPVKTFEEMGYAGPQWAVLGAAAGKLGAVLSRAKRAKPEDVAADLKKAQEEIDSTILYKKPERELKLAPEWQPKPEYPSIPFTGTQNLQFKPSTETPMRIGPRPPAAGVEIPPMGEIPSPSPETRLLAPPPDWIPGRPVTVRRPSLETPATAAEFKGPGEVFVKNAKGEDVPMKWNAEKKVYEPAPATPEVPNVEGVKYDGVQPWPNGPDRYSFTDLKTGSSFMTKTLAPEDIAAGRDRKRALFAEEEPGKLIGESAIIPPMTRKTGAGEIPGQKTPQPETRTLAPDYVKGYLSQYKKGDPGISEGLTRPDGSGELVYRDQSGKPVGVVAYSPKFITDIAVDPKFRRQGIATKLIEEVNKKGITEFRGPYSEEGAALVQSSEIPKSLPKSTPPPSEGGGIVYHAKTKGDFKGGELSVDIGSDADIMGKGFYFGSKNYASKYGTPESYSIQGKFATNEQWVSKLQKYLDKPIAEQRRLSREELKSQGYVGVKSSHEGVGVVWDKNAIKPAEVLSEEAKRAAIKIEGKTVNGLANDILSETPAKQNAAIEAVKKAVEEGKISQDEALHHLNNEMMNIATEKIKNGSDLNATLNAAQRAGMTFTEKIAKEVRPDAQAIFRKLKGEESGKVDLDLMRHLTISGLGAATGATIDEENRWRGAIIGGTTGFMISRGLLNKVLGRKFTAETPALAKEKIEVKPIKEGPITEPVLQLGINKTIANATEELFRAAGMKWDPSLLITDQITTAMNQVPMATFREILGNFNVPVEEFTKYYFRQSISKYAKGLGEWGAVVRRLMKDNPEAQKALDDISRAASDIDAMASAGGWWKRVDNIRRGLLVTQLATAMRNAETQAGRVGIDVFEQALDAGLQRMFKRPVTTNPLDGLQQLMTLFRKGNKADVNKILGAFPGENDRLFFSYSSDILKARNEGIPEKIVDALNIANRFQEYAIRRTVFLSKLDQRMRAINQDLEKIVKNNEMGKISEDDIKYAVNQALEFTWAQSPKYGSVAQKFISFVNSMPGATYLLPFPRFLMNSMKFQFDYSPLGAFKLLSSQERLAVKGGDMKTISRALLGTAMLTTAYQVRNSEWAGEKWYEINVGGKPIDTRAYNPFASYLFVADVIKKARDGSLYKLGTNDIIQGLFSTNLRAGSGLYVVDRVLEAFADESKTEKAVNILKQFGGEVAAGFLTPVKQVRDFLYGFDDMVLKETRGEPFLGPIKATLPGIEKGMEPRYKATRSEPPKWQAPGVRQATGISVGEAKNTLEKELDRLGFDRREILPSVGDAKADNLIAQKMGSISEEIGLPLLEDKSYRNMGEAEKGYFLSRMIGKFRTAAKKEAQGENPDLFEKITRTPKRKERFTKSLEGG